ncbi:MAG: hypothetical protein K0R57_5265 [Paenibacillaceae bacterium]|nr:hypothetical protein [Paenibacillaceae bacterium]
MNRVSDHIVLKYGFFEVRDRIKSGIYIETPVAFWRIHASPYRPRIVIDHKHKSNNSVWHDQGPDTVYDISYNGFCEAINYIKNHDWIYKHSSFLVPMIMSDRDLSKLYDRIQLIADEKMNIEDEVEQVLTTLPFRISNTSVNIFDDPNHSGDKCALIKTNGMEIRISEYEVRQEENRLLKQRKKMLKIPETVYCLTCVFEHKTEVQNILHSSSSIYAAFLSKRKVYLAVEKMEQLIKPLASCIVQGFEIHDTTFRVEQYKLCKATDSPEPHYHYELVTFVDNVFPELLSKAKKMEDSFEPTGRKNSNFAKMNFFSGWANHY